MQKAALVVRIDENRERYPAGPPWGRRLVGRTPRWQRGNAGAVPADSTTGLCVRTQRSLARSETGCDSRQVHRLALASFTLPGCWRSSRSRSTAVVPRRHRPLVWDVREFDSRQRLHAGATLAVSRPSKPCRAGSMPAPRSVQVPDWCRRFVANEDEASSILVACSACSFDGSAAALQTPPRRFDSDRALHVLVF